MVSIADLPLLATPKQAAEVLGISDGALRGLVQTRRIAHLMVGKRPMIPRDAIQHFITDNLVTPCRDEIQGHAFVGSRSAEPSTSLGPKVAAAGSAARARQIAERLKSPSPSSSASAPAQPARVIPLRSS